MIRIIIHGCCGRMGHIITDICEKDEKTQVVAGVDAFGEAYAGFPVYRKLEECPEADVVIDFSTASAVDGLLAYCSEKKLPVVVCTTGLSEEQTKALHSTANEIAVLKSANMSVGVNLIEALIAQAAPKLAAAGFDIEIVEKHHNQKIDAPSGTALALAGDHDVIFAGQDEVITLSHRAYSRAVFGKGAVEAAKFLAGREAGFYTMSDVLS